MFCYTSIQKLKETAFIMRPAKFHVRDEAHDFGWKIQCAAWSYKSLCGDIIVQINGRTMISRGKQKNL
jgi:hypothetical protein